MGEGGGGQKERAILISSVSGSGKSSDPLISLLGKQSDHPRVSSPIFVGSRQGSL